MILSIGEILVDIFVDKDKKTAYPGGAPFNVASNIAHFNNKEVAFFGAVGNDEYGKFLLKNASNKINHLYVDVLNKYHTTEAIVTLKDGERSFRFNRDDGADYHLDIAKLKEIDLSSFNIVHIGSLMLSEKEGRDFFNKSINFIKGFKDVKISFDVNYRDDVFESEDEAKKVFLEAIKKADIIKFTSEELELLTGEVDIKTSLNKLLNSNQIAVVTLGKDGSIFHKGNVNIKVNSIPLKPVDTTGAGDAFYSYFLYELDKNSLNLNESLIKEILFKSNIVGGLATQKRGAIDVVPSIEELNNFILKNK